MQCNEGLYRTIAFTSRRLNQTKRNCSINGYDIPFLTDHRPFQHIFTDSRLVRARWVDTLLMFSPKMSQSITFLSSTPWNSRRSKSTQFRLLSSFVNQLITICKFMFCILKMFMRNCAIYMILFVIIILALYSINTLYPVSSSNMCALCAHKKLCKPCTEEPMWTFLPKINIFHFLISSNISSSIVQNDLESPRKLKSRNHSGLSITSVNTSSSYNI